MGVCKNAISSCIRLSFSRRKEERHNEEEFIRAMTGSKQMGSVLTGSNQIHAKELGVLMQDFSQFTLKPNHIMCSISTLD